MTDAEYIEALMYCIEDNPNICELCPLYKSEGDYGCMEGGEWNMLKIALDIIKRKQLEIDSLKAVIRANAEDDIHE